MTAVWGCGGNPAAPVPLQVALKWEFVAGTDGWTAGFSDYDPIQEHQMALVGAYRLLPPPLDESKGALFSGGRNDSSDLFMYWKRRVDGLRPQTAYRLSFDVEFATNLPAECGGIGGVPGQSWVKAGASRQEPLAMIDSWGHYAMNLDKGNQSTSGRDAVVIGNVGNSQPCLPFGPYPYEIKRLLSPSGALSVTPDESGGVWLLVGTDIAWMGRTELYYSRISVSFEPS